MRRFVGMLLVAGIVAVAAPGWTAARLNVFVNCENPVSSPVFFRVKSLKLIGDRGRTVTVPVTHPRVANGGPFGQVFLTSAVVPEGRYGTVTLAVGEWGREARSPRGAEVPELKLPVVLELKRGESRCLFLIWNVRRSLSGGAFHPVFRAQPQTRPLRAETLYVACDTRNTLFAVRTDTNRVVASLATKERPGEMVVPDRRDRLFVLCGGSRSLLSVELSTFQVIDSLLLPLVIRPGHLALGRDDVLAVTDPANDQIVLVAADTGRLLRSRRLGHRLSEVVYWQRGEQFFVASTGEQKVYQLNKDLSTARAYDTGSAPRGMWLQRTWLFVADSGSGTVSVFNLTTGRLVGRVRSGRGPVSLVGTQRRLYIANRQDGTLGILWPGQMSISKRIRVGGAPAKMAVCRVRRWLYVADRKNSGVVVVDTTSLHKEGTIALGAPPSGVAVSR